MTVALTPAIRLSEVSKVYGTGRDAVLALDRVSLEVARGEFLCIVGASGCGKSTLLSLVAGLERPTVGEVEVGLGRPALMFQEPALLPWLTTWRNVELPLRLRRAPRQERRRTVQRLLDTVNLAAFASRRPHELSGGMRQRAALARALAQEAQLLLMDEPFAALDAITRDLLHDDLLAIWQANQLTVVFVTHNVHEAVRLGDRVVLLTSRPGRVACAWTVEMPRPRSLDSPEVARMAAEITQRLHEEIRRRGR
ncbi:MAG TPA: ABC transporter ATP-binding protein [Candidatus Dormibacteraeota bacterium]|nr:ABC transporter ATP-binding protein [Candidatus Dormibacteraeota bacterium]